MHNRWNGVLSLFSYLLLSISFSLTNGGEEFCYHGNFFSINSTYDSNRNLILSSLASYVPINNGSFYYTSVGQDPNKVYALALCRGDSPSSKNCINCVKATSQEIMTNCPNRKEAFKWGGTEPPCLVRYADHPITGKFDLPPSRIHHYGNLTENVKANLTDFDQIWETLMESLVKKVYKGSSGIKYFATEEANLNSFQKIYTLMQCTPDLSRTECDLCLRQSVADYQRCCRTYYANGGNVERANCYFGWNLFPFYSPHTEAPPSPSTDPLQKNATVNYYKGKKDKSSRTVIIIVIVAVMTSTIFICILIFIVKKARQKIGSVKELIDTESLQFDFSTIRLATDNFSDANKLGQGGFGAVYKGTLPNGQEIAIKRLSMSSKQGDVEFKNEVTLVARLQHRNLVKLLGFCLERKERILVYEFLPNSSLDHFIFDPIKREHLDWQERYKIIRGIARGLLYLHEDSRLRIIHRDLKASNILLDSEMNPKISDFGMARLFEIDKTHISTSKVVGTFGYMAPEYVIHQRFSVKTDVFSFGVMILEIVHGQRRSCFDIEDETDCLLTYAWNRWNEGTTLNVIDSTLREGSRYEMMKCIHIGLLCVQESVSDRPTMASVVHMLNSDSVTLPAPSKPGFFIQSSAITEASSSSLEYNLGSTESDKLKIDTVPLSQNGA